MKKIVAKFYQDDTKLSEDIQQQDTTNLLLLGLDNTTIKYDTREEPKLMVDNINNDQINMSNRSTLISDFDKLNCFIIACYYLLKGVKIDSSSNNNNDNKHNFDTFCSNFVKYYNNNEDNALDMQHIERELLPFWKRLEEILLFGSKNKAIRKVKDDDVAVTTGNKNETKHKKKAMELIELNMIVRFAMFLYADLDNINQLTFVKNYNKNSINEAGNESLVIGLKSKLDGLVKVAILKIGAFLDLYYLITDYNNGDFSSDSEILLKFVAYFGEFEDRFNSDKEHFLLSNQEPNNNNTLIDIVGNNNKLLNIHNFFIKCSKKLNRTINDNINKHSNYIFETFKTIHNGLTNVNWLVCLFCFEYSQVFCDL